MTYLARTPKQIGDIIRRERKKQKLTQAQLGQKASLRQETVSKIETGNPAARIDSICDLLSALSLELVARPRSQGSADDIEDLF